MKKEKVYLEGIDLTCHIADITFNDKKYEIDFDVIGSDVLVTPESLAKVKTTSRLDHIANVIESKIRNSFSFQQRHA